MITYFTSLAFFPQFHFISRDINNNVTPDIVLRSYLNCEFHYLIISQCLFILFCFYLIQIYIQFHFTSRVVSFSSFSITFFYYGIIHNYNSILIFIIMILNIILNKIFFLFLFDNFIIFFFHNLIRRYIISFHFLRSLFFDFFLLFFFILTLNIILI